MEACSYTPTADRAPSASSDTRAWLATIHAALEAKIDELAFGYPEGGDHFIEDAISDGRSMLDNLSRAMEAISNEGSN